MILKIRWFFDKKFRSASDYRKSVLKLLASQEDIMNPEEVAEIREKAHDLKERLYESAPIEKINDSVEALENAVISLIKPHPNSTLRDIFEVALVAIAIALAARTFLIQPMKIPTSSMQPTLYGVTGENLKESAEEGVKEIPGFFARFVDSWVYGISYHHLVAQCDGELRAVEKPQTVLPFVKKQRYLIGNQWHTLWFPPTTLPVSGNSTDFQALIYSNVKLGQQFKKGEDIIKLKVKTGDHLFVNRLIYNFRKPQLGEIIIFETTGINGLQQGTFYIKRLVGSEGDNVSIGSDRHLVVDGKRIDASDPNFEIIYGFDESRPYIPNQYFGHVNAKTAAEFRNRMGMVSGFEDETSTFTVRPKHVLAMGDNTMNSFDSRAWGDFERSKIIGRSGFIYWPISERWSWGYR
jgi:signal peptidase I